MAQLRAHSVGDVQGGSHGVMQIQRGVGHFLKRGEGGFADFNARKDALTLDVQALGCESQIEQRGDVVGLGAHEVHPVGPMRGDCLEVVCDLADLGNFMGIVLIAVESQPKSAGILGAALWRVAQLHQMVNGWANATTLYVFA